MTSVILIGMPGSGKSTVGVLLARRLGLGFVDTDLLIQTRSRRLLQEIIDHDGIETFLRLEEEVLLALTPRAEVVATGGSAVYSQSAMDHLRAFGPAIHLQATVEDLEGRLGNLASRGVVMKKGFWLGDLLAEREPLYRRFADGAVEAGRGTPEDVVARVLGLLAKIAPPKGEVSITTP